MGVNLIVNLINIAVVVYVFGGLIRIALNGYRTRAVIFYTFATASLMLSYVYWLVYGIMQPTERLVFAANEISEWAYFLMLGTSVMYAVQTTRRSDWSEYIGVFLFTGVNVALWISWSGEWVQDIVTGLVIAYWAYHLVRALKASKAVVRPEWIGFLVLFAVVIATQVITFLPGVPIDALYLASFLILAVLILYFYGKVAVILYRNRGNSGKENPNETAFNADMSAADDSFRSIENRQIFSLSMLILLLTSAGMYMSGDPYYIILLLSTSIQYVIGYTSLRREARRV